MYIATYMYIYVHTQVSKTLEHIDTYDVMPSGMAKEVLRTCIAVTAVSNVLRYIYTPPNNEYHIITIHMHT